MNSKKNVQTKLSREKCTGCALCANICPTKAVKMELDYKFSSTCVVNNDKCVECNKCIINCPQITSVEFKNPLGCYATYPNENCYNKSFSSGGAATLISKKFIELYNGVVCGCTWDEELNIAKHIIVDDIKDLYKFYGSKYVQSNIEDVYSKINNYIISNKKILFIGVPCQVAAILKKFNSENLYTMDLICHGTPPEHYLSEYIKSLPSYKSIKKVKFRGENDFWFTANDVNDKIIYKEFKDNDPYFNAFLKGAIYRDNCYDCKYAQIKRVSDITVGDFWELNRGDISYEGNISLVLTNSEHGDKLLKSTSSEMVIIKRCVEEAIKGNKQLSAPMDKNDLYYNFTNLLNQENNFINAFKKTLVYKDAIKNKKKVKKMKMKYKLKLFLQKIYLIKGAD